MIGTLVGAFFGHHLGAAGKERAEQRAECARQQKERVKSKVLAALPPEEAKNLLKEIVEDSCERDCH